MRHKTAASFRAALMEELREQGRKSGPPIQRLQKMVAFDRFLARLVKAAPDMWVLKGGLALQWRMGESARTTKDIDAGLLGNLEEARTSLMQAASLDLGDWFQFEVGKPTKVVTGAPGQGLRFPIDCLLDGRRFDRFPFDVGAGDPITGDVETICGPTLLDFAGIPPARIPCYPLHSQIAEKLHACTRGYAGGESSRAKDLVDILLIATLGSLDGHMLATSISRTFRARDTHPIPSELPKPPARWSAVYGDMAKELNLSWHALDEAWQAGARFLNPVLQGTATGKWHPTIWKWH